VNLLIAQKIQQELPSGFLTEGFFVEAIVLIPIDPLRGSGIGFIQFSQ
jgi:hypothetical protein